MQFENVSAMSACESIILMRRTDLAASDLLPSFLPHRFYVFV